MQSCVMDMNKSKAVEMPSTKRKMTKTLTVMMKQWCQSPLFQQVKSSGDAKYKDENDEDSDSGDETMVSVTIVSSSLSEYSSIIGIN